MEETTDNYVIKLKAATFISVIITVVASASFVTRTISKIEQLEERIHILDDRVTKTTGRNAKEILQFHKLLEESQIVKRK